MSKRIRKSTNPRETIRLHRKTRIRRKLADRDQSIPRLVVFRSNKFLYTQLIDDVNGKTLAQANSREKDLSVKSKKSVETATVVGKLLGERAKAANVTRVVFDRNGYSYHGRIKAIADGAREAGLQF